MSKAFLFSLLILLTSPSIASAQVVINEVMPNPLGEESGAEWVELYNLDDTPKSISGCTLYLHASDNYQNVVFGTEDFVDKFEVVSWDGSWLRNDGDQVRFVCEDHTDSVSYGDAVGFVVDAPDDNVTFGRNPDGGGSFTLLESPTLGEPNTGPPPTPTNTPTPTTKPTSTPKPTKTPAPTKTPTTPPAGGPTVKAAATKAPTGFRESSTDEGESESLTLGLRDELSVTPTPGESSEPGAPGRFPWVAGLFILAGLGFIGAAVYPFLKKRYNLGSETKQKDN